MNDQCLYFFYQGDFFAIRKLRAVDAFRPNLMRQFVMSYFLKTHLLKKIRGIGERKKLFYADEFRFLNTCVNQGPAYSFILIPFIYRQRFYLSQITPGNMHGRAANDFIFIFIDKKIPDIFIKLIQGTRKHQVLLSKGINKRLYLFYIFYARLANHFQ